MYFMLPFPAMLPSKVTVLICERYEFHPHDILFTDPVIVIVPLLPFTGYILMLPSASISQATSLPPTVPLASRVTAVAAAGAIVASTSTALGDSVNMLLDSLELAISSSYRGELTELNESSDEFALPVAAEAREEGSFGTVLLDDRARAANAATSVFMDAVAAVATGVAL